MTRPALAAWMIEAAREFDRRGRPVPPEVLDHIRELLTPAPTFPREHAFDSPATIEISSAEMAARTGYTVQHIRRLCRTGRLPARRAGRDWLIKAEEHHGEDARETTAHLR